MPLNLLSFFLSLFLNLFFLTVIIIGLTFPLKKKEEIKITFLEPIETKVEKAQPKKEETPLSTTPSTHKPLPSKREAPVLSHTKPQAKKLLKEEPLKEDLLRKRLSQIEEKVASRKEALEEELLKSKISSLSKKERPKMESYHTPPALSESQEKGILSEDYLFLIKRKLQNHFEIPIYLKNKRDLFVIVEIETDREGRIKSINYLEKSKDMAFNRAVEKCLLASNPLPVSQAIKLKIEFRAEGTLTVN